jgi:hypothetical protein
MNIQKQHQVDILLNPFLAVTADDCIRQFFKATVTGTSSDYVVVPEYDFEIISETKKSKKVIIFDKSENYGENITKEKILKFLKWKQCYLWTGGALELKIRESDSTFLDLVLSKDTECTINPNILRCTPFIHQILKHLDQFHSASPDEGICFAEAQIEGLDSYSFSKLYGPVATW